MTPERLPRVRAAVKTLIALALLAALGFAVAGCGSSQKAISGGPYVVTLSKKADPTRCRSTGR